MSSCVLRVEGLGKRYRLGAAHQPYHTLGDQLKKWTSVRRLLRRADRAKSRPDFWALKDVSFEVNRGECVGIIGRNGAGKSTLLKILSRITQPTEGGADISGRVGSLLEVGTGFHPELTGRENIYLNGAILGMRRAEIVRKFDEIVAFAEVEKFIETPVKHYSSGMYTRLAFAVAAHMESEILIVDEVLAVGDSEFQKKCLGKMGEVAKGGRTILFVSHNLSAVQRLCGKAILLRAGQVVRYGPTDEVVRHYLLDQGDGTQIDRPPQPDGRPTITRATLTDPLPGETLARIEVSVTAGAARWVSLDVRLTDEVGNPVGFGSLGALAEADRVKLQAGMNRLVIGIRTDSLALGSYVLSLDLTDPEVTFFDRLDDCLRFEVIRIPSGGRDRVHPQRWGYGSFELPVERLPDARG